MPTHFNFLSDDETVLAGLDATTRDEVTQWQNARLAYQFSFHTQHEAGWPCYLKEPNGPGRNLPKMNLLEGAYWVDPTVVEQPAFTWVLGTDVSIGPVQVPLGFIIVEVQQINRRPARSLAQATAEITTSLTTRKRREALDALYNRAQDALSGGASVAEVAQDMGLSVVTTPAPS